MLMIKFMNKYLTLKTLSKLKINPSTYLDIINKIKKIYKTPKLNLNYKQKNKL